MRAIREHLVDVAAIVGLVAVALVVAVAILANQRVTVPGWVPFLGHDVTEIEAELSSAQAVTPGQGQAVDVAGVEVGEISRVRPRGRTGDRHAAARRRGATSGLQGTPSVLLRPRTGLRDMVAAAEPGHARRRATAGRAAIPVGRTLPDVNLDEILAGLDTDTRTYLQLLLADAATGLRGSERPLADTLRRFEPTARDLRRVNAALAIRRRNLARAIHSFSLLVGELGGKDDQLATFVDSSNAVLATCSRARTRTCAPRCAACRAPCPTRAGRSGARRRSARRSARRCRRCARGRARSGRRCARRARSSRARRRSSASRSARSCARPTRRRGRCSPPRATWPPRRPTYALAHGVNALLNALAYNPPGAKDEGYLFWLSWLNHLTNAMLGNAGRARARAPRRRRGRAARRCRSSRTSSSATLSSAS